MFRFFNILFAFCLLFCTTYKGFVYGQTNLVPNFSFENYTICPDGSVGIETATGWVSPNAYSPDYYNSCANLSNPYSGVPNNGYGFQNPKTGVGYGGIYLPVNAGNDIREYIQVELTDPLTNGVEYIITFYVSLADSSNFSVNSLGAFLSNTPISSTNNLVFSVTPQVVNDPIVNPLTNKNIWQEVSDTITAMGGEKYMTIGNFQFDSNADTTSVTGGGGSPSYASYYFIDDVSVTEIFPNSVDENNQTQISIYPNPSNGIVYINSPTLIESLTIYSAMGQMVLKQSPKSEYFQVDLSQFSEGVYYININTHNSIITNKIIINRKI